MKSWLLPFVLATAASAAEFQVFLQTHCMDCHDSDLKKGGLDLSGFTDEASVMQNRAVWRAVFEKVESHQMPPPKNESQPTLREREELMA